MFLYMFAFQLTSVIEQEFFVRRSCMVNHNYTAAICENLKNYPDIQKEVQVGCGGQCFALGNRSKSVHNELKLAFFCLLFAAFGR